MTSSFDKVVLDEVEGPRTLSLEEFLRLPLHFRVQRILENRITFTLAGNPVDTREALKELRTLLAEPKKR